jgi:4-amino-4-deoxy-L-arabinose transferase-like glycosyltransferase
MERFREYRWLILILLVAACVRLTISLDRDRWPASSDEDHWERIGLIYSTIGIGAAESGSYRPPLYPLMISAIYSVAGADAFWVRLVQIGLSLATVWLVSLLAFRLGGKQASLVAAVLAGFYPLWTFFSAMIMAEVLLVFLVTLSCYLAIRFDEAPGLGLGVALGSVLGLAVLCKPVVAAWIPLVGLILWRTSGWALRKDMLNQAVSILCGFLVVLVPWMVRNEVVTGHRFVVSTNLGMNLLIGHEPRARGSYIDERNYLAMHAKMGEGISDVVVRDGAVAREVLGWIAEDPVRTMKLALRKTFLLWNSVLEGASRSATTIHFATGTIVVLFGLWGIARFRSDTLSWLVGSAALGWTIVNAIFFAHPRFRLPVDILLLPFAGTQLLTAWRLAANAVRKRMAEL